MSALLDFFSGAIAFAAWTAGLFFFKFRRTTRDRLFGFFAAACWLLAVERVALVSWGTLREQQPLIYLIRLSAFCLILIGILDKNRRARRDS